MTTRLIALIVTLSLALPAAASAMPIDNGPTPHVRQSSPPPPTRTIIRTSHDGDTLAIVLAGVAVLLAAATATYTAVRLPRAAALRN